ncbi:MAG: CHAD domain-containing protein [Candidatus Kapabacteria bacterium]|nr:CHAD domain-containing protein [Candidatus Kapabacteria bacterium]
MTNLLEIILNSIDKVLNFYIRNFQDVKKKFSEKSVHDLRVTIRRFLAILNVLNHHISIGYLIILKKRLKKELKLYNPLRDNQVQMLKIESLSLQFPILMNYLEFLRAKELELLNSIKEKINLWSIDEINEDVFFLKLQLKQELPKSRTGISDLVKSGYEEYLNVLERSAKLDKNNLDSFHQLRLAFKRFRYTMEFLQPILNPPDSYFKELKGFQDILGDIQDNRVLLENLNYWILNHDIQNQSEYLQVIEFLINSRKNLFIKLNKRIKLLDKFWDSNFLNTI